MPQVSKERMKELLEAEVLLDALQRGGVDNWEWYEASCEDMEEIGDDHPELQEK